MARIEFTKTCTNKKIILMAFSFVDFYEKKITNILYYLGNYLL